MSGTVVSTLLVGVALGMRHGADADHLTAIDGLSRIRPRLTNGLFFALGHGVVVTALVAGLGQAVAGSAASFGPWILIAIGVVNLCKVLRDPPTPRAVAAHLITMAALHRQNRYDRLTRDVEKLTGSPPMSITDFVRMHAPEFAPQGS